METESIYQTRSSTKLKEDRARGNFTWDEASNSAMATRPSNVAEMPPAHVSSKRWWTEVSVSIVVRSEEPANKENARTTYTVRSVHNQSKRARDRKRKQSQARKTHCLTRKTKKQEENEHSGKIENLESSLPDLKPN